ncbi:MAG TPA: carbon starvation protein A [Vicinamibacterales bacterium]|nr:carbon starvation protein A [Vicinamibacterales bacterium]
MHALYLVIPTLCIGAIAYRYYSAFIAARVMVLDDTRQTVAHKKYDGANFYPTPRWVLFGHHFAGITGAGPLVGPVLATQFGWAPGFMWLLAGCVLAGAVHDMVTLWASTRRGGRSVPEIARSEISKLAGTTAIVALLFILVVALAGLGIVFVRTLAESAWGTFTVGATIPIAIFMGFYMFVWRKGHIKEATIIGVALLFFGVVFGKNVAESSAGQVFVLSNHQITLALGIYAFAAATMPVWMLLTPRAYLSTYMKIGTILFLALGVILVNPALEAPAFNSAYIGGGGPIIPGPLFPFVFITIACGAISGFHAIIASGTTSKMVDKESDIRPVGYMAMLFEGLVGVMALIAAASLHPGDYFAINVAPAKFATLGMSTVNLAELQREVGEIVTGRTGGAVSLAVGMAQIFSNIPGMRSLMAYWYHFAIMFEAIFILTTIDSGTRAGRFLLQEAGGRIWKKWGDTNWAPSAWISSGIMVVLWGYFIWTGSIDTIWPLFGVANQLLGSVALAVGTTIIINSGRVKYAWVTMAPLVFLTFTTLWGGYLNVRDNYWPKAIGPDPTRVMEGYIDAICTVIMMICVVIILAEALRRWMLVLTGKVPTMEVAAEA